MIKTLYIKNFILIDELLLNFTDGFNVLIGETGAGKSIIIKAIDTVMGAKTSKDVLKNENIHALIEITFDNNGEELVISREISQTGTKCRINGALVNLEAIKEEKEHLIDIHTQFQTYTYMETKYHINLLDSYINSKVLSYGALIEKQLKEYKRYTQLKELLEKGADKLNSNKEKIEFLKFEIDEIEKADIQENEEEKLNSQLEVLSNIQELKELSYSSYWSLGGEDNSIVEAMGKIGFNLSKIKDFDPNFTQTQENYFDALETIKDVAYTLRNYSENLQDNPERLNEVNERLELIEKLKRKYGDIFEAQKRFKEELEALQTENISLDEIEKEILELEKSMTENSELISEKRKYYSKELSDKITEELKKLEFECPKFVIEVKEGAINSKGKNEVEFLITTNVSKGLSPLVKSASGGEISRVMLSIKTIFANVDKIKTVIFDEIDTGISGKTSLSVGNEISELSKKIQVFAITHQPVIASKANTMFLVTKTQTDTNTIVKAKMLGESEKVEALAKMSSGVADEKSLSFANELINNN